MNHPDRSALVDFHSHLVPGVDDGARDLDEALEAIARMTRAGIRRIVTTPHLDGHLTPDAAKLEQALAPIDEAWERLLEAAESHFPEVELHRGHEVMLDVPDADFSDARVRLAGTSFVLVEWPRLQIPLHTERILSRLRMAGYRPVVAHPERYHGIASEWETVEGWKRVGALLQINHGSLVGRYGKEARRAAWSLLRRGLADYLASDYHASPDLPLFVTEAREALEEAGAGETFDTLTRTNPARLLDDEDPMPVQPVRQEEGFFDRISSFFRSRSV